MWCNRSSKAMPKISSRRWKCRSHERALIWRGAALGRREGISTFLSHLRWDKEMIIFFARKREINIWFFFPRVSAIFFFGFFLGVFVLFGGWFCSFWVFFFVFRASARFFFGFVFRGKPSKAGNSCSGGSVPQRGTRWGRGRRRPCMGPEPPASGEGAGTTSASRTGGAASALSSRGGRVSPCAEAHARPPAMGRPAAGGGRPPAMGRPPFAGGWQSETGICALGAVEAVALPL